MTTSATVDADDDDDFEVCQDSFAFITGARTQVMETNKELAKMTKNHTVQCCRRSDISDSAAWT